MLRIENLHFSLAGKALFSGANAVLPSKHKVGFLGRNGTGKSTLLRLICGELTPDQGTIEVPARFRIGNVAQEVPAGNDSILDTVLQADKERSQLLAQAEMEQDPARIADIHARLNEIDAWSAEARAATIVTGLGFDHADLKRTTAAVSGGWRARVALAAALFSSPDLLLLDEPTNHLDFEGAAWLESFLARYRYSALIISHDRSLLNRSIDGILHLEDRKLTYHATSLDRYICARELQRTQAEAENAKAHARIAHMQHFVDRFRYKKSKAAQAQSRIKMIARIRLLATPQERALRPFYFAPPQSLASPVVRLENVEAGYNGTPVLRALDLRIDHDDRIALLGYNGQGKSTLARLIAGALKPLTGRVHRAPGLKVGYFAQHQLETLRGEDTPMVCLERMGANTSAALHRRHLAGFGIGGDLAEQPITALSGGQKVRLSLLLATMNTPHMLVLDEPGNHLDLESREALIAALNAYTGAVIVISHDMQLLNLVTDQLWVVRCGRVSVYDGDLDAYRRDSLTKSSVDSATGKKRTNTSSRRHRPPARQRPSRSLVNRSELRSHEAKIDNLAALRARLLEQLADPAIHVPDALHARSAVEIRLRKVTEQLQKTEARWMELQEQLESGTPEL